MNPQQNQLLQQFWANQLQQITEEPVDPKQHELPLARVKKVMKTDEDVRTKMMISSEAPALMAKACEIFILELTMRAWIQTEENKRRTLGRADVAAAINKLDMYDFLIDLVPREEATRGVTGKKQQQQEEDAAAAAAREVDNATGTYDQYYQHFMSQYPALAEAGGVAALQQQQQQLQQEQLLQQQQQQQQAQQEVQGEGQGAAEQE